MNVSASVLQEFGLARYYFLTFGDLSMSFDRVGLARRLVHAWEVLRFETEPAPSREAIEEFYTAQTNDLTVRMTSPSVSVALAASERLDAAYVALAESLAGEADTIDVYLDDDDDDITEPWIFALKETTNAAVIHESESSAAE